MSKKILLPLLSLLVTTLAVYYLARAGDLDPAAAPGDTMHTLEDIYCKITGCTPGTYGLDSSAAATGTMYTLEEIYDAVGPSFDYSLQKNLIWDDWKSSASSTPGTLAYAYSNSVDRNLEESEWSTTTDSSLGTETVASGNVYHDERAGLYWSDCYSSAQDAICDTIANNSFTLDGTVADADDGLDAEGGAAVDFCEALSLDADGDGSDETDWYLPSQKELMQAYINGAANNLSNPARYYWSSTVYYNNTDLAWLVLLTNGYTDLNTKSSTSYYARCVRR